MNSIDLSFRRKYETEPLIKDFPLRTFDSEEAEMEYLATKDPGHRSRIFEGVFPILEKYGSGKRSGLDVGCAQGLITKLAAKFIETMVGVDISKPCVVGAHRIRPKHLNWVHCEGCHLPFRNFAFDLTICTETLEHVPDPSKLVEEIRRVCSKVAVFSTPLTANFKPGNYHLHGWSNPEDFKALIQEYFPNIKVWVQSHAWVNNKFIYAVAEVEA